MLSGKVEVVEAILGTGALTDYETKANQDGLTALQLAEKEGHKKIQDILRPPKMLEEEVILATVLLFIYNKQ